MKKMYYVPETEITWVTMEQSFLSNGENVTINRDYANMAESEFWD